MEFGPPWFLIPVPRPEALVRLICVPFAGGGASAYRDWAKLVPAWVEVVAFSLPGREGRFRERAIGTMEEMVSNLSDAFPSDCKSYVLFGHSMGALIAFELTRALRSQSKHMPAVLFVSGMEAPHLRAGMALRVSHMSDDAFANNLRENLSYSQSLRAVLLDPELTQLFLPTLRTDFELVEKYQLRPASALDLNFVALGGDGDRCSAKSLEAWREHTTGKFSRYMFPGNHFFIQSSVSDVLATIVTHLKLELDSLHSIRNGADKGRPVRS